MAWMWTRKSRFQFSTDPKVPQLKSTGTSDPPAGGKALCLCVSLFEVKNSTKNKSGSVDQKRSAYACPMELDVSGTKVPVEVHFIDDWPLLPSTKAQLLKVEGVEAVKDRFQNKTLVDGPKTMVGTPSGDIGIRPRAPTNLWAAFDENDADYSETSPCKSNWRSTAAAMLNRRKPPDAKKGPPSTPHPYESWTPAGTGIDSRNKSKKAAA